MNYATKDGSFTTLSPRGTLYKPLLGTGPLLPVKFGVEPRGPDAFLGRAVSSGADIPKRSISDQTGREISFNPVKRGQFPNGTSITRDRNVSAPAVSSGAARRAAIDNVAGPLAGIAGGAALLSSTALPVAAGLGIGYGVFKLGESLRLW